MLEQIIGALDDARDLLSRIYDTPLTVHQQRWDFAVEMIEKHSVSIRKTTENIAALAAYVIMKNTPVASALQDFNPHLAFVVVVSILGNIQGDEGSIAKSANIVVGRLQRLDLTDARVLVDGWVADFKF